MKAQENMIWKATFEIDKKYFEEVAIVGHIGKGIKIWKGVLAKVYSVTKTKVVLVERWQEPVKK